MTIPPPDRDTILVVDDEIDSLRMIADMLEGAGMTALVASSGVAAIELLAHAQPDLIVMDAMMPGLDGFQTTARIKASAPLASIPLIFMTGLIGSEHVAEGFRLGAADYVRKPVVAEELLVRVRAHIGRSRAMQASLASLEASGRRIIAADRHGRLRWCPPGAEPVLAALEPGWNAAAATLPQAMLPAVQRLFSIRKLPGASAKLDAPSRLELVLVSAYSNDTLLIRLNEIDIEAEAIRLQDNLGLTRREAEVLLWVSYGKPSRVIGAILKISPRTVHKHLERIFEKLGIETRSAAAAIAIRQVTQ